MPTLFTQMKHGSRRLQAAQGIAGVGCHLISLHSWRGLQNVGQRTDPFELDMFNTEANQVLAQTLSEWRERPASRP